MQVKAKRTPFVTKTVETIMRPVMARMRERRKKPVNKPTRIPLAAPWLTVGDGIDVAGAEGTGDSVAWGCTMFDMSATKVFKAHRGEAPL